MKHSYVKALIWILSFLVEADTGNIGGKMSHEFHLASEAGEDVILVCDK